MDKNGINASELETQEWESLFVAEGGKATNHGRSSKEEITSQADGMPGSKEQCVSDQLRQLSIDEYTLAVDAVNFVDSSLSERLQRSHLSARQLEQAKHSLSDKGLIKQVWVGKVLLLAPTEKLYFLLGMESPYRRNTWDIHSFLVLLAAKLIESNALVKYVKREVLLCDSGSSTIDCVGYLKDGNRIAYEVVHRGISNICTCAAKVIGKNFTQLVFLCTEFNQKERVCTTIRNCGFNADFLATIRYQLFGVLLRQKKQMILKEMR